VEHGYLRDTTDKPPPEDVKEVAGLIGLTLPPSYASWLEVRFLELMKPCVDDGGGSTSS
jgi:hypothetical protein